jgi:hypothetical protein
MKRSFLHLVDFKDIFSHDYSIFEEDLEKHLFRNKKPLSTKKDKEEFSKREKTKKPSISQKLKSGFTVSLQCLERINIKKLKILEKSLDIDFAFEDAECVSKKKLVLSWTSLLGDKDSYISGGFIHKPSEFGQTRLKGFGRLYSKNSSLAYFPKEFFHFLLSEDYVLFEVTQSYPRILILEFIRMGLNCPQLLSLVCNFDFRFNLCRKHGMFDKDLNRLSVLALQGCNDTVILEKLQQSPADLLNIKELSEYLKSVCAESEFLREKLYLGCFSQYQELFDTDDKFAKLSIDQKKLHLQNQIVFSSETKLMHIVTDFFKNKTGSENCIPMQSSIIFNKNAIDLFGENSFLTALNSHLSSELICDNLLIFESVSFPEGNYKNVQKATSQINSVASRILKSSKEEDYEYYRTLSSVERMASYERELLLIEEAEKREGE